MTKSTSKNKKNASQASSEDQDLVSVPKRDLKPVETISRFTDFDIHLFKQGKHFKLYEKLGSHVMEVEGVTGTYFAVWAPNASSIAVIGNFN
jgi:1,4-alpha-glucan branching enzyme